MSLIRFQNVTMAYENRVVLREVYFRLWAGERVGLIWAQWHRQNDAVETDPGAT